MQEQVNEKTAALSIKAAKITERLLAQAMRAFLKRAREPTVKTGRQSMKSLAKQGASLTNIEIDGDNIGAFSRIARKYNVAFALKKDTSEPLAQNGSAPKWYVFFKAKDADALTAAFKEYTKANYVGKKEKPSLFDTLEKAKEEVQIAAPPVKSRKRGEPQL